MSSHKEREWETESSTISFDNIFSPVDNGILFFMSGLEIVVVVVVRTKAGKLALVAIR